MFQIENLKPFLKYAGGKTQLLKKFNNFYPSALLSGESTHYIEPFVGGGAVFFDIVKNYPSIKSACLSDTNVDVIVAFKVIKESVCSLLEELHLLSSNYYSLAELPEKEKYYYQIRDLFNSSKCMLSPSSNPMSSTWIQRTAQFIFLNKTCFRGVYRESKNGFNVPFGNYKNPSIYDENHILQISDLIKDVLFTNESFENIIDNIREDDFVYLDPPYYPENEKSFVDYNSVGFDEKMHKKLFQCILGLKCKFVMSNSDVKFSREYFKNYKIETIVCKRSINSKNPSAKTNEIMVYI